MCIATFMRLSSNSTKPGRTGLRGCCIDGWVHLPRISTISGLTPATVAPTLMTWVTLSVQKVRPKLVLGNSAVARTYWSPYLWKISLVWVSCDRGLYCARMIRFATPLLWWNATKLGLPAIEAIRAATTSAADLMGWQDRVGSIEAGKYADIIDPLADITE